MKRKLQLLLFCFVSLVVLASCSGKGTKYTVTFKVEGKEDVVETYEWGDEIQVPEVVAKEGYTFVGWDDDVPKFMPAVNLVFTAVFEETKYSITYQVEGMEDVVVKYKLGEKVEKPADPVVEGHTFTGWDKEIPETMPKENLVIKALLTKNTYTITYQVEGMEDVVASYEYGSEVVVPELNLPLGTVIEGWETEMPKTMPAENLVLKAIIKVEKYTITYQAEGMEDVVVLYAKGEKVEMPTDPVLEGHTFAGWDKVIPEEMPAENLVIKAKFTKNSYNVTFKVEGSDDIVQSFEYGTMVTAPEVTTIEGYEFAGWDQELPVSMPAKDLVITAVLTKKVYTITYKALGVEDIVQNYEFEAEITLPKANYRNGYLFKEWIEDVPATMPAKNLVINGKYEMDPDYNGVLFIGHAGCYSGIMNTETAFLNAAVEKGYQAIECDLKQTKDGVFVVCHDDTFNGIAIAQTNYADLKDVTYTTTRGGISYTSTICTLERYLEICKEYDVYAVIELKWSAGINNNDQSRMPALMEEIAKMGMTDKVIFLASQYKCLEWVRNNGYKNIQCQYLVNSADSETVYNRCVEWNFDVSFNIGSTNTKEWIDRYHAAGLKVSSYTFNQYQTAETLQKWIDLGVDYVTCDKLVEGDVTLPDYEALNNLPRYKVQFLDHDGTVLLETTVRQGNSAASPLDPKRTGYEFAGWDKAFTNVTSDLVINATYNLAVYNIIYNDNMIFTEETSWVTKAEFVNEFYQDWFDWFTARAGLTSGITKNGDTITVKTSAGTATFASAEELKGLDIYAVEKTIAQFVYKPIEGKNSADHVFEVNNDYFLQTEPYRSKYQDLNRYFLNVINTSYSSYSSTYTPNSAGKVQIFFRFHQWQKGTNIPAFDALPKKYNVTISDVKPTMPTTHLTYTFEESFTLDAPTCEGYTFAGWYLDQACSDDKRFTSVEKGTTGDIILFAKWVKNN